MISVLMLLAGLFLMSADSIPGSHCWPDPVWRSSLQGRSILQMKQAKRPTLAQKKVISGNRLDWKTWNVIRDSVDDLVIRSKKSGQIRTIKKVLPPTKADRTN